MNQAIWAGLLASFIAGGIGTAAGAGGVFIFRQLSARLEDALLSVAAGIMLAATFFSLLLPALEHAEALIQSRFPAVLLVSSGILLGAVGLWFLHQHLPHEHFIIGNDNQMKTKIRKIWLFIMAITLHNFPEGMAVGVAFAGSDPANAITLATGIGLQNIPEGLAVAASLLSINHSRLSAFIIAALTGMVEPIGGLIGASLGIVSVAMLPCMLGLAAGAMLFVISHEIIPETHRRGYEHLATFSLIAGFVLMMLLDATLG